MGHPLSEMNLETLWKLFPIVLKQHDGRYFQWYWEAKEEIQRCLKTPSDVRLSHIGSTAVSGLLAKPIVDILLEISLDLDPKVCQERLTAAGWICMSEQWEPMLRLSFNKGYTLEGFAKQVYHLHLRREGDHDELYFRDYLRTHPSVAAEYAALKQRLFAQYEHNRDGYTQAKTAFITRYTMEGKRIFAGRYETDCRGEKTSVEG